MIVPFMDSVVGTAVYINPRYVVTLRPDPDDPTRVTMVKLEDGEAIRVQGEHGEVANKLAKSRQGPLMKIDTRVFRAGEFTVIPRPLPRSRPAVNRSRTARRGARR